MLNTRPAMQNIDGRVPVKGLATGSKTPGRTLSKSRGALRENALGSHTVHRAIQNNKHTPFRAKTQQHVNKPLLDKTPFHNRQNPLSTPAPQTFKIAKLGLGDSVEQSDAPLPGAALLRPSSTRKSLRGRSSGSAEKMLNPLSFQTPVNQGRHWDVSDISIEVPASEPELHEATVEEDYDEIEYAPPRGPDPPYQAPFDFGIPNYKELGLHLRSLPQLYKFDDEDRLVPAQEFEFSDDMTLSDIPRLKLPELGGDDDPFSVNRSARPKLKIKPIAARKVGALQSKSAPAISIHGTSSNHGMAGAGPAATSTVRPGSTMFNSGPNLPRRVPSAVGPVSVGPVSAVAGSTKPRSVTRSTSTIVKATSSTVPSFRLNTSRNAAARNPNVKLKPTALSTASVKRTVPKPVTTCKPAQITTINHDSILVFDVRGELEEFRFDV